MFSYKANAIEMYNKMKWSSTDTENIYPFVWVWLDIFFFWKIHSKNETEKLFRKPKVNFRSVAWKSFQKSSWNSVYTLHYKLILPLREREKICAHYLMLRLIAILVCTNFHWNLSSMCRMTFTVHSIKSTATFLSCSILFISSHSFGRKMKKMQNISASTVALQRE